MSSRKKKGAKGKQEELNFIKSIEPRANRGANISKLLEKAEKNKDDSSSEDDFWKNNPLFGEMDEYMDDEEGSSEYSKEASVADEFDADFEDTSSDEEEDEEEEEAPKKKSIFDKKKPPTAIKKFIEKEKGKTKKSEPVKTAYSKKPATSKASKAKTKMAEMKDDFETDFEAQAESYTTTERQTRSSKRAQAPLKNQMIEPEEDDDNYDDDENENIDAGAIEPEEILDDDELEELEEIQTSKKGGAAKGKKGAAAKKKGGAKGKATAANKKGTTKAKTQDQIDSETPASKSSKKATSTTKAGSDKKGALSRTTTSVKDKGTTATTRGAVKKDAAKGVNKDGKAPAPKPARPTTRPSRALIPKPQPLDPTKKGKYIHDYYTQEDLMKEAALTEIYNQKSLANLLALETDKKDYFIIKRFEIDGPKSTYKSKINEEGDEKGSISSRLQDCPELIDEELAVTKKREIGLLKQKIDSSKKKIITRKQEEQEIQDTLNFLRELLITKKSSLKEMKLQQQQQQQQQQMIPEGN